MVQNASRLACARQCQVARGAHDAIHRSHGRRPTTRKGARTLQGSTAGRAGLATVLDAPLDLILVRKIGVPFQPELAMGAVVDGREPVIVRNEDVISLTGVSEQEFTATCDQQLAEIERRRKLYLGDRPHPQIAGRTVIVVDDGIATGATTRAALQATRMRKPSKLVLAIPVAPTATLKDLRGEADDIVCLEDYEEFGAIGLFYSDFRQVSDTEVIELLARHPAKSQAVPG